MGNLSWLLTDKVIRAILSFVLSVALARILGAENFGVLNYCIAFIAFFSVFSTLGLDQIVSRELVDHPLKQREILQSAYALRLIGSIVAIFLAGVIVNLVRSEDRYIVMVIFILSLSFVFRSFDVVRSWFEAQVLSKYIAIIECVTVVIFAVLKIAAVWLSGEIMAIVVVMLVEAAIMNTAFLYIYYKKSGVKIGFEAKRERMKTLLSESWPVILNDIAILIYMRVDIVMISHMLDDTQAGIYSTSVKIGEALYFLPFAFASTFFPMLIKAKREGAERYRELMQTLTDVMVLIALPSALFISIYSESIITLVWGVQYIEAAGTLQVHAWTALFVFLAAVGSRWYVIEKLHKLAFYRTVIGAILNVLLNLLLIPKYGIIGAAYAIIVSQSLVTLWIEIVFKRTRSLFFIKLSSLMIPLTIVRLLKFTKSSLGEGVQKNDN